MDTAELRALKREFDKAGIEFVREGERKTGARIGLILARSRSDQKWIAIGSGSVNTDLQSALQEVLEAVAQKRI